MRVIIVPGLLISILTIMGCGPGRFPGAKVTGTVTVDGKPLPAGSVLMESADGKFNDSGPINSSGEFTVDNAPLGKVKVCLLLPAVFAVDDPKGPKTALPENKKAPHEEHVQKMPKETSTLLSKVPAEYKEIKTTKVTFEVQSGSNSPLEIAIKTR